MRPVEAPLLFWYAVTMKNAYISARFNHVADLLGIKGDNAFRIRAYRRAALALETLGRDVAGMAREDLPGIPDIEGRIWLRKFRNITGRTLNNSG